MSKNDCKKWNLTYPIVEFKESGLFFVWFLEIRLDRRINRYPFEYPMVAFKFFGKEEIEEAEGLYPMVEFNKLDLLLFVGFWSLFKQGLEVKKDKQTLKYLKYCWDGYWKYC